MSKEITHQDLLRNNITYDMFVDSADQNYVVARWCFQKNLALDFLWNATHCLEKFMKAVLLLNGRSAIKPDPEQHLLYGHDLALLYPQIILLAGSLLPDLLVKPNETDMHWRVESGESYVARISANGNANNRYQMYGYVLHAEDLYKFDRMVFAVRRLCCPLDSYLLGNIRHGQPTVTFREQLEKQPDYMPHIAGSRWEKLTGPKASEDLRYAALNHNLIFAPEFNHGDLRPSSSAQNPVLGRRILLPDEQGVSGARAAETVELIDWVVGNILFPKEVREQLAEARVRLTARI